MTKKELNQANAIAQAEAKLKSLQVRKGVLIEKMEELQSQMRGVEEKEQRIRFFLKSFDSKP